MKCPFCSNEETKVTDKRDDPSGFTRRRRECLNCQKRFTTYERVENLEIVVVKKDGAREPYSREKVANGIYRACEKRPVCQATVESLVDEIESEIRSFKESIIESRAIGEIVMRKLRFLDEVAYVRFASVYRCFSNLENFEEELNKLQNNLSQ